MVEEKKMLNELRSLKAQGLIDKWVIHKGKIIYTGNINEQSFIATTDIKEWKNILRNINEIGKVGLLW